MSEERQRVAGQAGWDPERNCWQFTEVYWEKGRRLDNEWENDTCVIARTEMILWIEISCYDKDREGNFVLKERSRESEKSYILAERICKDGRYEAWTEESTTEDVSEEWDVDGEYWRSVDD